MKEGQSFESFEKALFKKASDCDFKCRNTTCRRSYADELIKTKLISAATDPVLRLKLLEKDDISLAEMSQVCRSFESVRREARVAKVLKPNFVSPEEKKSEYNPIKCYRCSKEEHFAKICPTRKSVNTIQQEDRQNQQSGKFKNL